MASSSSVSFSLRSIDFSFPWNDSDAILLVEDKEVHVHRSILLLQSPVFKAMLCGQFVEATAKHIPLPGKTHKSMVQFLQLLYPTNMIKGKRVLVTDENVNDIITLADEYQAINVVIQCLDEIKITGENAFRLLPYANKYDKSFLPKFFVVTSRYISAKKIQESATSMDDEKLVQKLLLEKCNYLERLVYRGGKCWETLLSRVCSKQKVKGVCGHAVSCLDFQAAKLCLSCVETYKRNFLANAVFGAGDLTSQAVKEMEKKFLHYLELVNDIVTSSQSS